MSDMTGHQYAGEYRSGIARAKKILLAAGFPWSKTTGRYAFFDSTQRTADGVRVTRVGCSNTIATYVINKYGSWDESRLIEMLAIATLREAGLPFDDRGWLECGVAKP